MVKDKLKLRGDVAIVIKAADGSIKDTRNIHNLVVDDGLNFIVSRMKDTTQDAMTHMAVGSSATAAAAGQTDLVSILGSREALDSKALERLQRQASLMPQALAICFVVLFLA